MSSVLTFTYSRFALSRLLCLLTGFFLFSLGAFAQQNKPDPREEIFSVVEQPPTPADGYGALVDYINKNMVYPDSAAKARVTGKVFVGFVVEEDGQITNVSMLKSLGYGCDEEAMRVVQAMPRWNPGRQSGRAVRVKFNLPISFMPQQDVRPR